MLVVFIFYSLNGGDDDLLFLLRMSFKGFSLYIYMWLIFQWIELREEGNYFGKFFFVFYKIMRVVVVLSLWVVMCFEIFNVCNGLLVFLVNINIFILIVVVMYCLFWMLCYVIFYYFGLYFFEVYRGYINDILINKGCVLYIQW